MQFFRFSLSRVSIRFPAHRSLALRKRNVTFVETSELIGHLPVQYVYTRAFKNRPVVHFASRSSLLASPAFQFRLPASHSIRFPFFAPPQVRFSLLHEFASRFSLLLLPVSLLTPPPVRFTRSRSSSRSLSRSIASIS